MAVGIVATNASLANITAALAAYASVPKYVTWGTGSTTPAKTDIALANPANESAATGAVTRQSTSKAWDTIRITATLVANANKTISEVGWWDAASSGNLCGRSVFTPISLQTGDSITFTINSVYSQAVSFYTKTVVAYQRARATVVTTQPPGGEFNPYDGTWYWVTQKAYGYSGSVAVADGVTDDTAAIQQCINASVAASPRKGVYFPPTGATYKILGQITIPAYANIRGYERTQSVLYMPARYPSSLAWMFFISNQPNVTVKHLGFKTDNILNPPTSAYPSRVGGMRAQGCSNLLLDYLRFDETQWGISTGTHTSIASNYTWSNIKCWHCYNGIKMDDLNGGTFTNWEIDAVPMSETNSQQWHGMYLERNCTNLTFTNTTWTRASGYCIHAYNSAGGTGSHDITFNNTTIDARQGREAIMIGASGGVNPYYNIWFNGLTIPGQLAANESQAVIRCYATEYNIFISGLNAYGYRLLDGGHGTVAGTYRGAMVGVTSPNWTISGLSFTYEAMPTNPPGGGTLPVGSPYPGAENA